MATCCAGGTNSRRISISTRNGNGAADAGDEHWNGGEGWDPIFPDGTRWLQATLEGNGRTIRNLFIDRATGDIGLMGHVGPTGVVRNLGVVGANVSGDRAGVLAGVNHGRIVGAYATGKVDGTTVAGGMVAINLGNLRGSYAATNVSGPGVNGGLVGSNQRWVLAGYATGRVEGADAVGGLFGQTVAGSGTANGYSTGPVAAAPGAVGGGLVGRVTGGTLSALYWDTETSGQSTSASGVGHTGAVLKAPTGYTGLYATWNEGDVDGDGNDDDVWNFGTNAQYPALRADLNGDGVATWQEFGYQLREGPVLTVASGPASVALTWTAVDVSHWSPPPPVRYTVRRHEGSTVTVIADAVDGLGATDIAVSPGVGRSYQVSALVGGGEAAHSPLVVAQNRPPAPVGTLPNLVLQEHETAAVVSVSAAFQDPDGDHLTYGASSDTPSVALASASGPVVTVTPLAPGLAMVTVTATDAAGSNGSAVQRFGVDVQGDVTPEVTVSFGSGRYQATEGGTARVLVRLDRDPERRVEIPLELTHRGGASPADYSGVPSSVYFDAGATQFEFPFRATDDNEDDDGETVALSFGALPFRVSAGGGTILAIQDNDTGGGGGGGGDGGDDGGDDDGGDDDGDDGDDGGDDDGDDGDDGGDTGDGDTGGGGEPPQAAIALQAECVDGLCPGLTGVPVRFEDASSGTVSFRRWDFGDGGSSRSRTVEHSWTESGFYEVTLLVSDGENESTVSRVFLIEASEPAGTCAPDEETRCLRDSRFAVEAEWSATDGGSGAARVVRAGTDESGLFSFFGPENWEVLIKVLDGCAINGHVWVYGASTTDLGYVIRVTDTATGAVREYRNEPGVPASAIVDGEAFPEGCRP